MSKDALNNHTGVGPSIGASSASHGARDEEATNGERTRRVSVEPATRGRAERPANRGSGSKQTLWSPELRDGADMPQQGPEVLDILFRLGVLTIDQVGDLLPRPIGADRTGEILGELASDKRARKRGKQREQSPLVRSVRHPFRYVRYGERPHWKTLYYLSGEGLGYVARRRDLYPSVAESLYKGVLEEARIDHALLRNEFYRRLVAQVPRIDPEGPDTAELEGETLWAEKGMKPIKLPAVEGNDRRYLNPDGLLELVGPGAYPQQDYRLKVYIESDTGSEDMDWQVSGHAEKYAEHFLSLLESQSDRAGSADGELEELPVVLFVSPTPRRTSWVRTTIRNNGLDSESVFAAVRKVFKERDKSLPALFWFTNFKWLEENGGPRGAAYFPLSATSLVPLIAHR